MTTIRLSNGIVKDDVLVVGLSAKSAKGALQIEAGDLALDTKALLPLLSDLGATGKADEVIKIPGTTTRLIVFTGLGKSATTYNNEVLRRAAGAAVRALAGNSSATISLPAKSIPAVKAIAEGAALGFGFGFGFGFVFHDILHPAPCRNPNTMPRSAPRRLAPCQCTAP